MFAQTLALNEANLSVANGDANLVGLAQTADDIAGGYKTIDISRVTLDDGTNILIGSQSGGTVLSPDVRTFMLDNGVVPLAAGDDDFHAEGNAVNSIVQGVGDVYGASDIQSIVLAPSKAICLACVNNGVQFQSDSGITITLAPGVTASGNYSKNATGMTPWVVPWPSN